jgi:hypothetical protein
VGTARNSADLGELALIENPAAAHFEVGGKVGRWWRTGSNVGGAFECKSVALGRLSYGNDVGSAPRWVPNW